MEQRLGDGRLERSAGHIRQMLNSAADSPNRPPKQYGLKPFKQAVFFDSSNGDGSKQLRVSFHRNYIANAKAESPDQRPILPSHGEGDPFAVPDARIRGQSDYVDKPNIDAELLSKKGVYKRFVLALDGDAGFPCPGCLDIYPTEFTLQDHLSRNSYTLSFDCSSCQSKLSFTNKCLLYYHLMGHFPDNPSQLKFAFDSGLESLVPLPKAMPKNNAEVPKQLPVEDNDIQEVPDPKSKEKDLHAATEENKSPVKPEPSTSPTSSSFDKTTPANPGFTSKWENTPNLDQSTDQPLSLKCYECNTVMRSTGELSAHFNVAADPSVVHKCAPCQSVLPTACALNAHKRVHGLIEPFICPECGTKMFKKNVFLKHLRLACLHYSKGSEYPCPTCTESFNREDDQLKHLKLNPAHLRFDGEKSYFKCNGCPKAFKSAAAHSKHKTCPGAGCTVVHMCNNCTEQTVFRSFTELQEHREKVHPQIIWVARRVPVYSCYLCIYKSRNINSFCEHLFKEHQKKKIEMMCQYCGVEVETQSELDYHLKSCMFKQAEIVSGLPGIVVERVPKISSGSSNNSEAKSPNHSACGQSDSPTVPMSLGVNETTSASTPASSAVTPIAVHTPPSFACHICTMKFTHYIPLREHVRQEHNGMGMIYECWVCREKGLTLNFYKQRNLDKHLTEVHKIQISVPMYDESVRSPESNGRDVGPPAKKPKLWGGDSPFQCCRCHFSSADAGEFKNHIKEHKSVDSHQCSECGMCFPVQLALRRHLFVVHKVSDYVKYSRSQYMVEYEQKINNVSGVCPVCEVEISDKLKLKQHIRTHGMVYINTQRN